MPQDLREVFDSPKALLSLQPEELAAVILEVLPAAIQNGVRFNIEGLTQPMFYRHNVGAWPEGAQGDVTCAIAEALSWLKSQGLIMNDPTQAAAWMRLTRRGQGLKTRQDLASFRRGGLLPIELLQPNLAKKVQHLFLRGDHDTAVFQAFKEVEVAVRGMANSRGANYPDNMVGVLLMQNAFNPEKGPLTDKTLVPAERQAEMFLFAGAIGHAKNPASHREVNLAPHEACRLILFASHLLDLVEKRVFG